MDARFNETTTKREMFAAMALQGLLANPRATDHDLKSLASTCVDVADALISALTNSNKQKGGAAEKEIGEVDLDSKAHRAAAPTGGDGPVESPVEAIRRQTGYLKSLATIAVGGDDWQRWISNSAMAIDDAVDRLTTLIEADRPSPAWKSKENK